MRPAGAAFPAIAVAATAIALVLPFGVGIGDAARFVLYELLFVLIPGLAALQALAPARAGLLERLAIGAALGHVLAILAFIVTGELGLRGWFLAYPFVVAVPSLVAARLHSPIARAQGVAPGRPLWAWSVAGVCVLAAGYLAIAAYASTPFPWEVTKVWYLPDLPFHLSLAAEAEHHWPVSDPSIAGVSLPYHVWANLHMGAVADVIGIPLPVVAFRLFGLSLVVLLVVQLVVAGRMIGAGPWTGVLAAVLTLFVGEVDLDYSSTTRFLGIFARGLWLSPSFLLGLVFFVPAVIVLARRLSAGDSEPLRDGWRDWTLFALLAAGCAGAKATVLPVLAGGLCLFLAWQGLRARRVDRSALTGLAITLAVAAVFYVTVYRGAGGYGLELEPLGSFRAMPELVDLRERLGGATVFDAFWIVAPLLGLLGLYGPALIGLPWVPWRAGRGAARVRLLLAALFVAGLLPLFLTHQTGNSELYFANYGFVAGCLLSAEGLLALASGARAHGRTSWRRTGVLAAVWTAALLLASMLELGFSSLLVIACLALLAAIAVRRPAHGRKPAWVLFATAAVVAGLLDLPLDHGAGVVHRVRDGTPLYSPSTSGITRGLYGGLAWLREHTSENAVVAVNNHYERDGELLYPSYYYYSGFGGRRIFLEGWAFSARARALGYQGVLEGRFVPFPERLRLNEAVFERADRRALRILVRDHGVRYLLVDRVHGTASPLLAQLGSVVFSNPDVTISAVGGPR